MTAIIMLVWNRAVRADVAQPIVEPVPWGSQEPSGNRKIIQSKWTAVIDASGHKHLKMRWAPSSMNPTWKKGGEP